MSIQYADQGIDDTSCVDGSNSEDQGMLDG
jgi:hypothetical protein